MEPQKIAHEMFDFGTQLLQCRPTVRGRKNYQRILRQIVKRCKAEIDDKRVKK